MTYHMERTLQLQKGSTLKPCQSQASNIDVGKVRFPEKLYEALEGPVPCSFLQWSPCEKAVLVDEYPFQIHVMKRFPGLVQIPDFVNFRRQLRVYGFDWSVCANGTYRFAHPSFYKGGQDQLANVLTRRREGRGPTPCKRKISHKPRISKSATATLNSLAHPESPTAVMPKMNRNKRIKVVRELDSDDETGNSDYLENSGSGDSSGGCSHGLFNPYPKGIPPQWPYGVPTRHYAFYGPAAWPMPTPWATATPDQDLSSVRDYMGNRDEVNSTEETLPTISALFHPAPLSEQLDAVNNQGSVTGAYVEQGSPARHISEPQWTFYPETYQAELFQSPQAPEDHQSVVTGREGQKLQPIPEYTCSPKIVNKEQPEEVTAKEENLQRIPEYNNSPKIVQKEHQSTATFKEDNKLLAVPADSNNSETVHKGNLSTAMVKEHKLQLGQAYNFSPKPVPLEDAKQTTDKGCSLSSLSADELPTASKQLTSQETKATIIHIECHKSSNGPDEQMPTVTHVEQPTMVPEQQLVVAAPFEENQAVYPVTFLPSNFGFQPVGSVDEEQLRRMGISVQTVALPEGRHPTSTQSVNADSCGQNTAPETNIGYALPQPLLPSYVYFSSDVVQLSGETSQSEEEDSPATEHTLDYHAL